jgi:hypothetical protein
MIDRLNLASVPSQSIAKASVLLEATKSVCPMRISNQALQEFGEYSDSQTPSYGNILIDNEWGE